jgi:nucleoside phosphorylase
MKRRFDVAVVVPLDEEFETALKHFQYVANLSTAQRIRFEVAVPGVDLTVLLVKQNVMGRMECASATMDILDEFDVGMLVCLGIAGGLSSDLTIGDICRTGEVFDLLDNAKVTDAPAGRKSPKRNRDASGQQIAFSPTHYATPVPVSVALDLDRLLPERRATYDQWAEACGEFARTHLPNPFTGKDAKKETVGNPVVKPGTIACASVSDSPDYNKAIKKLDRKILAVETESGGLFSIGERHKVPALSQRSAEQDAAEAWSVSICLLGSGAERLEAKTKRNLIRRVIRLTALIVEDWTRESAATDYKRLKQDMMQDDDLLGTLANSKSDADIAKRTIDGLVDLLEFSFITQPFRMLIQGLCEEARDTVLAESVVNTPVEGLPENLIRSLWLADLDAPTGAKSLTRVIKELPPAKWLRMILASHLITRVYWRHWDKDNRLKLLATAQEVLKGAGLAYDKASLQRLIDREGDNTK